MVRDIVRSVWKDITGLSLDIDPIVDDGNLASMDVGDWVSARGNSTETQQGGAVRCSANDSNNFGASTPIDLEAGTTYAVSIAIDNITDIGGSTFSRVSADSALSTINVFSIQDDELFESTFTVPSTATYHIGVVVTFPGASGSIDITVSVTEV